jgi:hypothetical protein
MVRILTILILSALVVMPQAWGYTQSPYPNPYRQTMWNNLTDSIHTIGQSSSQAKKTRQKLHGQRVKTRLGDISKAEMAKFKAKRQAWINSQQNQP